MINILTNSPVAAVLPVRDLTRAKKFYKNKLGLKVLHSEKGLAIVGAGKGTSLVIYVRPKVKIEYTQAGFEVKNIEKIVDGLKKKGVKFEEYSQPEIKTVNSVATHGKQKAAWFKDTEGNILSLNQM